MNLEMEFFGTKKVPDYTLMNKRGKRFFLLIEDIVQRYQAEQRYPNTSLWKPDLWISNEEATLLPNW
jgi:hypothetical protein